MASDTVQLNDAPAAGFGAALKRLRRAAGLSQEALAERAGISTQAISALESGLRKSPYPKTVAMLAAALGLDPAESRRAAFSALACPQALKVLFHRL